ncbi:MAG: alpha/beta hydrolase [Clostridia bacterium]|nr:alpha/beta hydrolase [Clostridia bacterium]
MLKTVIYIITALAAFVLAFSYVGFRMSCVLSERERANTTGFPKGAQYEEVRPLLSRMIREADELPYEPVEVKSFDGLTLEGRLYRRDPSAPVEIMFHGYKGSAVRDFSGGIKMVLDRNMNAIVITERGHGGSSGNCLTFGINERQDVLTWVNFAVKEFGPDVKIIIAGISMGGATVLMASDLDLPENVKGIVCDCGYTSPEAIIKKVIGDMKLPASLVYPFVRLGAKLYGGFDLNSHTAIDAVKKCRVPVYFIHGTDDRYVPYEMGVENYNACNTKKWLFTVEGAGHGLCFIKDRDGYDKLFNEFLKETVG